MLRYHSCSDTEGPQCALFTGYTSIEDTLLLFGGTNFKTGAEVVLEQLWAYRRPPIVNPPPAIAQSPTVGGTFLEISGLYFGSTEDTLEVTTLTVRAPACPHHISVRSL